MQARLKNFRKGMELINSVERWKVIANYDNYSISSFGRVRNDKTNRILKPGTDGSGYYYVNFYDNGNVKKNKIHKLVANAFIKNPLNKRCVDHIDRNPKNNHITNLRFATIQENNRNASKKKNNTTGYIGVTYHKPTGKYVARFHLNGKRKHIGLYTTKLEASEAYQAKVNEHYGEFANN